MTTDALAGTPIKVPAPRLLAGVVIATVIASAAAVTFLLTRSETQRLEIGKPRIVSPQQLASYAESAGRPVYWAGQAADGYRLELTEEQGQRVFVRYLADSAQAGDPRPAFTTVATYPMQDAYERLRDAGRRPGAVEGTTTSGALTLHYRRAPSNVYLAEPGSDRLVEVFAPQPGAALGLARSALLTRVR